MCLVYLAGSQKVSWERLFPNHVFEFGRLLRKAIISWGSSSDVYPSGSCMNIATSDNASWPGWMGGVEQIEANKCNDGVQIIRSLWLYLNFCCGTEPPTSSRCPLGHSCKTISPVALYWQCLYISRQSWQHSQVGRTLIEIGQPLSYLKKRLIAPRSLPYAPEKYSVGGRPGIWQPLPTTVAVVATTLFVLLFVVSIVALEYLLMSLPQSESAINVGIWGPWLNAARIILAAFIAKKLHSLQYSVKTSFKQNIGHNRRVTTRKNGHVKLEKAKPQKHNLEQWIARHLGAFRQR